MNSKKIEAVEVFSGQEGAQIRQIFSPVDTDNTIRYSLTHCTINPGNSSKPHTMKTSEMFYILQGKGIIHVGKDQKEITKNETIFVPPMSKQFIENKGEIDLIVLCIVDPAWKKEDEIIE
ncbi:MAG: cupin domain-containing protein [Crenarchaeota archaeon]|nr:cupin domain-containing protein [Thermoproteota archaeon]MDA1124320.1 cupin domain-containing protein [Thermoproteota archaeon]